MSIPKEITQIIADCIIKCRETSDNVYRPVIEMMELAGHFSGLDDDLSHLVRCTVFHRADWCCFGEVKYAHCPGCGTRVQSPSMDDKIHAAGGPPILAETDASGWQDRRLFVPGLGIEVLTYTGKSQLVSGGAPYTIDRLQFSDYHMGFDLTLPLFKLEIRGTHWRYFGEFGLPDELKSKGY